MLNDLRAYVQMASGITEATAAKARDVVGGLLAQGMNLTSKVQPAQGVVDQVQELADELVETSRNNRELLVGLIRSEVDKAVGRMGFVREDELAALRRHVQRVEGELADVRAQAATVQAQAAAARAEADALRASATTGGAAGSAPMPGEPSAPAPEADTERAPKAKKKIRIVEDGE